MRVFGTEMHLVTFLFLLLEVPLFFFQLFYFLLRPQDQGRKWYFILLSLLISYNVAGGLLPDPNIPISIVLQNILAYGTGFTVGAFFPYYFYRAFNLSELRFHAVYGVLMFLIAPYVIFFVISYSINQDLDFAIKYGIVIPFFYSFILLFAIINAISKKYERNPDDYHFWEMIAVFCAVLPWATLAPISYFKIGQFWEAILTNGGFVVITIMFVYQYVRDSRKEYSKFNELCNKNTYPELFEKNCIRYGLTNREAEVANLMRNGDRYKQIAEHLFISEKTLSVHIQHIFEKTKVNNRTALAHKLIQFL